MKKLIKNYLKKKLDTAHPKHYNFLRWLAGFVEDVKSTKYVCRRLAGYAHSNSLNGIVNDVIVLDDVVYLNTMTPGLWIGSKGKTFDDAVEYINSDYEGNKVKDYKMSLIELGECPFRWFYEGVNHLRNNY